MLHESQVAVGTITGTGAAINKSIGFKPRKVELYNETTQITLLWTSSMAAAEGYKRIAAGTTSFITANGISQYTDSTRVAADGFTLGTDSINVNTNVIHYVAHR